MPDDQIPLIPEVPEALREAAQQGRLVPFVGAGVSQLGGCPGWRNLADDALKSLRKQGVLTYAQIDQLARISARVKLSIADVCQDDGSGSIDFDHLLHPDGWATDPMGRRVYGALSDISRTFVTTNYDRWLDQMFPPPDALDSVASGSREASRESQTERKVFCTPEEFTAANLDLRDTVFHLHGSVDEPRGLIVTTRDYLQRYANDRPGQPESPVPAFLRFLFLNRTVLFVGYGLDELEVLEYVIEKAGGAGPREHNIRGASAKRSSEMVAPQHFILQGFFSHQRELMHLLRRYYEGYGVGLLPFSKDEHNWAQLADVLEHFARELPRSTGDAETLRDLEDMRGLLDG